MNSYINNARPGRYNNNSRQAETYMRYHPIYFHWFSDYFTITDADWWKNKMLIVICELVLCCGKLIVSDMWTYMINCNVKEERSDQQTCLDSKQGRRW